jgi:hypothetical protein
MTLLKLGDDMSAHAHPVEAGQPLTGDDAILLQLDREGALSLIAEIARNFTNDWCQGVHLVIEGALRNDPARAGIQQMFDRWISAERFQIVETSGEISGRLRSLWHEARQAADEQGLDFDQEQDETWGFLGEGA